MSFSAWQADPGEEMVGVGGKLRTWPTAARVSEAIRVHSPWLQHPFSQGEAPYCPGPAQGPAWD